MLSKLCRKFGFEYIKELMPEQDKKLVAHMQTTAERELRAKKTRLAGGGDANGGDGSGGRGRGHGAEENDGRGGVTKALRTFDAIMEGEYFAFLFCCSQIVRCSIFARKLQEDFVLCNSMAFLFEQLGFCFFLGVLV